MDVSASAVDEIVNAKLDEIVQQMEDEQIKVERKLTAELNALSKQHKAEMQTIKEDAEEEIEYIKERVQKDVAKQQKSG